MPQIDGKQMISLVPSPYPEAGSVAFVLTTDQTAELIAEVHSLTLTVTAPGAVAQSYVFDPAGMANGPVPLAVPEVVDTPQVGQPLSVRPALWALSDSDGTPVRSWQWQSNGVDIPGATSDTFTPGAAEAGMELQVVEALQDQAGQRSAVSAPVQVPVA